MNRVAACIKLVQILSASNDYISTKELAEILDTNARNIREYIKELEVAGYVIQSSLGIYGGYKLDKSFVLPNVKLEDEELDSLYKASAFLANSNEFMEYEKYQASIGKILAAIGSKKIVTPITMIDRFPLAMDKNKLQERYNTIEECISSQIKLEINYTSQGGKSKLHIIHPYKQFLYNGSWFVLAFNETINDFGYFKLNRIDSFYKTRNHFTLIKSFDEANYLDGFGMKQNGEYYHIELELENLNTAIKERIYGKNQEVEVIDNNHIKFSCDMQNKSLILSFVLSLGNKCKVISPEWLIDDVKNSLWSMMEIYE